MFYCIFRRESAAVNSNLQVRRLREEASEAGSKYTEVVKVCRDHILNMYIIKGNTVTSLWKKIQSYLPYIFLVILYVLIILCWTTKY